MCPTRFMSTTGVPCGLCQEVFGQGKETKKGKKKKLLRGNSFSLSGKEHSKHPETSAGRGSCLLWLSIQCCTWKTFLFPGSFGKWRNTTAVKYKLGSVMNTSGCKFQNYLVSLLPRPEGGSHTALASSASHRDYLAVTKRRNLN